MKERPILFKGEMVRAILDGRKTQTRRIVKPPKWSSYEEIELFDGSPCVPDDNGQTYFIDCPQGTVGDRLWVRETWRQAYTKTDYSSGVGYRADAEKSLGMDEYSGRHKWRPSIFMPRWASRITLEITGGGVERLQDISEEDADAEGFGGDFPCRVMPNIFTEGDEYWGQYSIVECFKHLWESINGSGSWEANPWVWVIEFKRIK